MPNRSAATWFARIAASTRFGTDSSAVSTSARSAARPASHADLGRQAAGGPVRQLRVVLVQAQRAGPVRMPAAQAVQDVGGQRLEACVRGVCHSPTIEDGSPPGSRKSLHVGHQYCICCDHVFSAALGDPDPAGLGVPATAGAAAASSRSRRAGAGIRVRMRPRSRPGAVSAAPAPAAAAAGLGAALRSSLSPSSRRPAAVRRRAVPAVSAVPQPAAPAVHAAADARRGTTADEEPPPKKNTGRIIASVVAVVVLARRRRRDLPADQGRERHQGPAGRRPPRRHRRPGARRLRRRARRRSRTTATPAPRPRPRRPSSTGGGASLDSAATDKTPFTADALVAKSFTDDKNVAYALKNAGVRAVRQGRRRGGADRS